MEVNCFGRKEATGLHSFIGYRKKLNPIQETKPYSRKQLTQNCLVVHTAPVLEKKVLPPRPLCTPPNSKRVLVHWKLI